jgi:4-amino-4-deoxy-L-arabinose transferase-like glycosyltransferase
VRPAAPQARRPRALPPTLSDLSPRQQALALALLVAALATLVFPRLGAAPLERAEIYFLDAARAMVEGGDWLVPLYEGQPFFDKPILTYWLMAAAMRAFGTDPAAARLVPAVCALLLVVATGWLGARLFDRRTGVAGALVLATTIAFLSFARVAMSDMLLALLTTLALGLAVGAWRPRAPWWTVPLLGTVLGLGFATKGPIALVVPGLALLLLAWENRRLVPCGPLPLAGGILAALVLGLGWFALVYARLGAAPLAHFFLRENLERFAGEGFDVGRPFWFYPPAYFAEGLPWSPLLPIALARLLRSQKEADRRPARFLALWAALVLVPLSLARGKIDYYLLPLYPALSLLVARYLVAVPWRRQDRAWVRAALVLEAAALAFVLARPPRLPAEWLPGAGAQQLMLAVLALALVALLAAAWRPAPRRVAAVLAAAVAAAWLVLVLLFLPAFAGAQPNRAIARDVAREKRYRPGLKMAFCSDPTRVRRDVLFATGVAPFAQCDLWSLAASREPYLLLATPAEDASFRAEPRYREVARYRYLPAKALTLDGLFRGSAAGEIVLGANFATDDPEADRKRRREYRRALDRERAEQARGGAAAP